MARKSLHVRLRHGVPKTPDVFDRHLSDDFKTIVSHCERCGEVLRGTVEDGLPHREVQHFIECSKKKPPSSEPAP